MYDVRKMIRVVRKMFRILLIEDDEQLFNEIQVRLAQWALEVHGIDDFSQVMQQFTSVQPDLVVIDIQLPQFDGFHWCRMIRSHSKVPIIFLSSRDHPTDMVMAMELGADDYVQKPFHFEVLIAKIQAILRRVYNYTTSEMDVTSWNESTVDYRKNTISTRDQTIRLTKNETYILRILLEDKGQIVSRTDLIEGLWDDERFVSDNTLTVNVNRLRKKLIPLHMDHLIETKVGQGYIAHEREHIHD